MALQHLRSSTADKRPTPAAMSDGQLALNTNLVSPGLFFKDSNGDTVKIGPVHVGTTAPNVSPAVGGEAGNSLGEAWLDTTAANPILKVFNGSAFVAVQPVGTGTVVSTTDTGTVTSTMILDGTILNADINASAAIVDTKLATIATGGKVSGTAITSGNISTSGSFTSTSTVTGTNLIPTGSGVPTNGIYLPAANSVAVATNGTQRITIDSSGRLLAGTATARSNFFNSSSDTALQLEGTGGKARMSLVSCFNSAGASADVILAKQKSGSVGGNTIVASGDTIGTLSYQGSDGTEFVEAANIKAFVDGTPGANDMPGRLVFSTTADGGSSPSERLRITSAGLVGIGVSGPANGGATLLTVRQTGGDLSSTTVTRANAQGVTIADPASSTSNYGNGVWFDSGSLLAGIASTRTTTSNWGTDLRFYTHPTTTTNADETYERMRIDPAGRVGIGTTSPAAALDVVSTTEPQVVIANSNSNGANLRFQNSATGSGQTNGLFVGIDAAEKAIIYNYENTDLLFGTNSTERARIDSSGRLGIGTSTPQRAVTAQTNSNGASLLLFRSSETNNDYGGVEFGNHPGDITSYRKGAIYYVSDGTGFGRGSIYICNDNAGDSNNVQPSDAKVVITTAGNVGIGVTTPADTLHVRGPVSGTILNLDRAGSYSWKLGQSSGSDLTFTGDTSERVRFTSDGKVLVGTTTSSASTAAVFRGFAGSPTGQGIIHLQVGKNNAATAVNENLGSIRFANNEENIGAIISAEADLQWNSSDYPTRITFSVTEDGEAAPRERMRISQDGKISIGLGDFTNGPLQVYNGNSSQGVAFVASDGAGNEWHFGRAGANGYFYVVRQTGTGMYMNTNSWVATSDQRVKQNIADIESTIDVVKALKPSRFNWKADGSADVGFIAQQVQPLIPEAVVDSGDPDAMLGITQDKLLPFVVKALQEAVAKIESLEARLTAAGV
jgi:hypothetical protein